MARSTPRLGCILLCPCAGSALHLGAYGLGFFDLNKRWQESDGRKCPFPQGPSGVLEGQSSTTSGACTHSQSAGHSPEHCAAHPATGQKQEHQPQGPQGSFSALLPRMVTHWRHESRTVGLRSEVTTRTQAAVCGGCRWWHQLIIQWHRVARALASVLGPWCSTNLDTYRAGRVSWGLVSVTGVSGR